MTIAIHSFDTRKSRNENHLSFEECAQYRLNKVSNSTARSSEIVGRRGPPLCGPTEYVSRFSEKAEICPPTMYELGLLI